MNIRLDDNVRIRLDSGDVALLSRRESCVKKFTIHDALILSVTVGRSLNSHCDFNNANRWLEIGLSDEDFARAISPASMKDGLNFGSVNIQVDVIKPGRRTQ